MKRFKITSKKRVEFFHGTDEGLELFLRDYFTEEDGVKFEHVGDVNKSE